MLVVLLALSACSPVAPAITPSEAVATSSPSPLPSATAQLALCNGYPAQSLVTTTSTIDVPAGATRLTIFYSTHTHGLLVRQDGVTFAQYVGVVRTLQAALPDPAHAVFLGNGDDLNNRLCGSDTGSRHVVDAFNAAGLAVDTFGYNEVAGADSDVTPDELRGLVAASRFTWVSANVLEPDSRDVFAASQGARRWTIRVVGGIKVGITGLVSLEPAAGFRVPAFGREMRALDPVEAMKAVVPEMRAAGADLVIVMSHMHVSDMARVARETSGIDAILGSHCCTMGFLDVVNGTILSDGLDNMNEVAQLDLVLAAGRVIAHAFSLHGVSRASPADAAVVRALEPYAPWTR